MAIPEKLTNDKHSSLLQKSVIYGPKSFITMGPGGLKFLGKNYGSLYESLIYLCSVLN
jgi:hypothetical protein